jgi:hypothetical protein
VYTSSWWVFICGLRHWWHIDSKGSENDLAILFGNFNRVDVGDFCPCSVDGFTQLD